VIIPLEATPPTPSLPPQKIANCPPKRCEKPIVIHKDVQLMLKGPLHYCHLAIIHPSTTAGPSSLLAFVVLGAENVLHVGTQTRDMLLSSNNCTQPQYKHRISNTVCTLAVLTHVCSIINSF
jgi:hypothetical protein